MWTSPLFALSLAATAAYTIASSSALAGTTSNSVSQGTHERPRQDEPYRDAESSARLTEEGWAFIPTYTGEHRWSLGAAQRAQTLAGLHILAAATALDPENQLAWWRHGHAATLLGNDDRARDPRCSDYFTATAHESLSRARELAPEDPWSAYALAMANANLGLVGQAVENLHLAIELCAPGIEAQGPNGTPAWIAFKCREWLGELLMRAGRFDEANVAIRSFYADFGENAWPERIALGECALRGRDFATAREQYAWIIGQQEFATDPQAHAMLGYLEGLLGNAELADAHLTEAIVRERSPQLYARLWRWILAPERREQLRPGLDKFLAFPPPSVSAWDLRLGRFLLGEGDPDSLLSDASIELSRRWEQNENPGDLLCEAHFYSGLRHELDAGMTANAEARLELLAAARAHYGKALGERPIAWKWEWAYARVRDAELCATLGQQRGQETLESIEDLTFERVLLHPLGAEAPLSWSEARSLRAVLEPGDLLLWYRSDPEPEASRPARTSYTLRLVR